MRQTHSHLAFTLAELLIALAILGVIATFTIPKILDSGSSSQSNSIAKEMAGAMSEAYQLYKLSNSVSASTTVGDFTPYLNYVRIDSVKLLDHHNGSTSLNCSSATYVCLDLHNGASILYQINYNFGDTSTTSAVWFYVDPDGEYGGSTTGPSKGLALFLYVNGRIVSWGEVEPNTYVGNNGVYNPTPANVPTWFSWSN